MNTDLTRDEQVDIIFALEDLAEHHEDRADAERQEAEYSELHGHYEAASIHRADSADHAARADRLWALSERITRADRVTITGGAE